MDPKSESVVLASSESAQPVKVPPSGLAKKLPSKEPCYTFYSWPKAASTSSELSESPHSKSAQISEQLPKPAASVEDEVAKPDIVVSEPESSQASKIACIYTCPAASPVRYRMLYSCSLRGLIRDALDIVGLSVDQKVC